MRSLGWLLALTLPVLAGCLTTAPGAVPDALPAVPALLDLVGDAVRIDREQPAREPSILEAADGALYVAGFWGFARATEYPGTAQNLLQGPLVWKSEDAGATWRRLDPGQAADGAISNSDLDLAEAPDGTIFLTSLSYYSAPTPPGLAPPEGAPSSTTLAVVVGSTPDGGEGWTWTRLDAGQARSHPWVAVSPGGLAHVVWGDGMGVRHAVSADGGATWAERDRVHADGQTGGIAIAPGGAIAVRIVPIGAADPAAADGVAVSEDDGATWDFRPAPGVRSAELPQGFDPVAFDGAGRLYFAWSEENALRLARSADLGAAWDTFEAAREPEGTTPYFPFLRGGEEAGRLALSWFAATGDLVAARAALVEGAHEGVPRVRTVTFLEDTGGTNHADYYQVELLRGGGLGAPVPVTTADLGQWLDYAVAR